MIIFSIISGIISSIVDIADINDIPATRHKEINYSGEEWFVIFKIIGSMFIAALALSMFISGIAVIFTGVKTNKDKKLSALIGGGMMLVAVVGAIISVMLFSSVFSLDILSDIFRELD